jgi:hypothetical protein
VVDRLAGFEPDGLAVLREGLVELTFGVKSHPEAVVGIGVILLEADGLAVLGDGLVQKALIPETDAEVVVVDRLGGMVGLEADDSFVSSGGLIPPFRFI